MENHDLTAYSETSNSDDGQDYAGLPPVAHSESTPTPPQEQQAEVEAALQGNIAQQQPQPVLNVFWKFDLQWKEEVCCRNVTHSVPFQAAKNSLNDVEIDGQNLPENLLIRRFERNDVYERIDGFVLNEVKSFIVQPEQCESLEILTRILQSGRVGCITLPETSHVRMVIIMCNDNGEYQARIPINYYLFKRNLKKQINLHKANRRIARGRAQKPTPPTPSRAFDPPTVERIFQESIWLQRPTTVYGEIGFITITPLNPNSHITHIWVIDEHQNVIFVPLPPEVRNHTIEMTENQEEGFFLIHQDSYYQHDPNYYG